MFGERTSAGLDVHGRTVVAAAIDGVSGEIFRAKLVLDHGEVIRWLASLPGPVAAAFEAGPTGFGLARALEIASVRCVVAAPSKLQRPSGDRVKTDSRDALHLARLLRLGEITPVTVPTENHEAARDLVRARDDVRRDLTAARHRTSNLLLRQGIIWSGGSTRTQGHHRWLAGQAFTQPGRQLAFEAALEAVVIAETRRNRLDCAITTMAREPEWAPVVTRLQCLRGISTLTAFGLAVEIGDWSRFSGSSIGAFLGLVPTERSSGERRSQGGITKTGNSHARRLLVEAAWHHRRPYRATLALRGRWDQAPAGARARGHQGNQRLHDRWATFVQRRKRPTVANVAIARELSGWCWSLATLPG